MEADTKSRSYRIGIIVGFLLGTLASSLLLHWLGPVDYRQPRLVNNTTESVEMERSWEDPDGIRIALSRHGLGENGSAASLEEERQRLYLEYGFEAILSDYISVNRSVPDFRDQRCRDKKYLAKLPRTTVVIIFHNEYLSVLLRTVHSVLNRSPAELLNEVILVDDCSTADDMKMPLSLYLEQRLPPPRVRLIRLPQRVGLMGARMAGARAAVASSEAFVFLDSHFEVNYSWLPPLLEPIELNPRACTCPMIDYIYFKNFEYRQSYGFRGYFEWTLWHRLMGTQPEDVADPTRPYRNLIMLGGAMAIGVEFFWQLGGFDEGMQLWGGEQFEMSFKVWLCGGELLEVHCSRMGHIFRDPDTHGNTNLYGNYSFVARNTRRVIEVWMDEEHREYVFKRLPNIRDIDFGNVSDRHAIRERMQVKSFGWLMDLFPDQKKLFPPIEPTNYAHGVIENLGAPGLCIDDAAEGQLTLSPCAADKVQPPKNQFYTFTWRRQFMDPLRKCLEPNYNRGVVWKFNCHDGGGNQFWYFDHLNRWLRHDGNCVVANPEDLRVEIKPCDRENPLMLWQFGFQNETRLLELDAEIKGQTA